MSLKDTFLKPIRLLLHWKQKHPLASFVVQRSFGIVTMLLVLGLAVFGLMSLAPGDIVDSYVKSQMFSDSNFRRADNQYTEEAIASYKAILLLDKPFWVQYGAWLGRVIQGDLGRSLINRAPVAFLMADRMRNSLILNLISLVILTLASFAVAISLSRKAGTRVDMVAGFFGLFFHAFPSLLLLILLQLFASWSGLFPVTAYPSFPFNENPVGFSFSYLHHIFLPLFAAFIGGIGGTMRMVRATMLDQLGQPYITALRSRGVSEKRITYAHAFRNTMNPFITSSSNLLAGLFSGSLILEIIFSYPGLGRLMYEAVRQEDINLVVTNLMFTSVLILVGMLISDILLALVDPRIRYSSRPSE